MTVHLRTLTGAVLLALMLAACGDENDNNGSGGGSDFSNGGNPATTELVQARPAPRCPQNAGTRLAVPAGRERTWSVCGNLLGSVMYLSNLTDMTLLVYPGANTTLSVEPPFLPAPGEEAAVAALRVTDPAPDPQANGTVGSPAPPGWVYVGPMSSVWASARSQVGESVPAVASMYALVDYYATLRYAVARASATYVNKFMSSKLDSLLPRQRRIQSAAQSCVQDLKVTADDVNAASGDWLAAVSDAVKANASCKSLVKTLTEGPPNEDALAIDVSKEVKTFGKTLVKSVPKDLWSDLLHTVVQILGRA